MKSILSLQYLAWRLGVPLPKLREMARQIDKHYREWSTIDHKKGKARNFRELYTVLAKPPGLANRTHQGLNPT